MKKINFLHVGYHKTASTWFQKIGYPSLNDIKIVNRDQSDMQFFKLFIEPDNFNFSQKKT